MILLCGIPSEPPLARVADAADELGIPRAVLGQRHASDLDAVLDVNEAGVSGAVTVGGQRVELVELTGIYLRFTDVQALPEMKADTRDYVDPNAAARTRALHEIVEQLAEVSTVRVLNRHGAMASNGSKPFQAQLIRASGLSVPETLVTNDPEAVRRFRQEHGSIIFKSTSALRSIVRAVSDEHLTRLDRLRALPTQFQAFVPGTNVRVHVVGSSLFATGILTEAVDYRYAGRDGLTVGMRAMELPVEVTQACLRLSALLELPLCGIDLKRTPEGQFFCFEVNPSPAFTYYEDQTEQPIAQAIARYLAGLSS